MSARDEAIGEAVRVIRGSMSQEALADHMRRYGYKWSQSTVWAVERGDRPLRFSEALDLATVFRASLLDLAAGRPVIAEPYGLGAVVEDVRGRRYVRCQESRWLGTINDYGDTADCDFAAIHVVRVLSEGVAS